MPCSASARHAGAHLARPTPNGLRLSGDGGEAGGVRCSRGLGATNPGMRQRFTLCSFVNAKVGKLLKAWIVGNDMPYADDSRFFTLFMASAA